MTQSPPKQNIGQQQQNLIAPQSISHKLQLKLNKTRNSRVYSRNGNGFSTSNAATNLTQKNIESSYIDLSMTNQSNLNQSSNPQYNNILGNQMKKIKMNKFSKPRYEEKSSNSQRELKIKSVVENMFATHGNFYKTISSDVFQKESLNSKFQQITSSKADRQNLISQQLRLRCMDKQRSYEVNNNIGQSFQLNTNQDLLNQSRNTKIKSSSGPRGYLTQKHIYQTQNINSREQMNRAFLQSNEKEIPEEKDSKQLTIEQVKEQEVKAYNDTRNKFKSYLQSFSMQNKLGRELSSDSLTSDSDISIDSDDDDYISSNENSNSKDIVPSELDFEQMPFHYQYNQHDSDFLKEKKYQLRLRDLYKMLAKNQVVVLPDPAVRCKDGMPLFQIFTSDFREQKKYQKFKNAYMAGDVKKLTADFMSDIIQPQVNRALQQNKKMTQSESLQQDRTRLKTLIKQQKLIQIQKQEEIKENAKKIDVEKTKQEYNSNYQLIKQERQEKEKDLRIKQQKSKEKTTNKVLPTKKVENNDLSSQVLEKQDPFYNKGQRLSAAKNIDQLFSQYQRRSTVVYQPSLMMQAFMIQDTQDGEGNDRFIRVKEDWIDMKRKLEKKIRMHNQKHEVVSKIIDMIRDRDSPSPKYKSVKIREKYEEKERKKKGKIGFEVSQYEESDGNDSKINSLYRKSQTLLKNSPSRNKSLTLKKMSTGFQNQNTVNFNRRATLSNVFFERKDREKRSQQGHVKSQNRKLLYEPKN
eukprot:403343206